MFVYVCMYVYVCVYIYTPGVVSLTVHAALIHCQTVTLDSRAQTMKAVLTLPKRQRTSRSASIPLVCALHLRAGWGLELQMTCIHDGCCACIYILLIWTQGCVVAPGGGAAAAAGRAAAVRPPPTRALQAAQPKPTSPYVSPITITRTSLHWFNTLPQLLRAYAEASQAVRRH